MDEDAGVKAPVTRLRRRLSVEQTEESKSPAINTPKKRGGRKAAKPELELIDENTPDNTTTRRSTKKTATKDVTESEEKTVTPSRRTTRIKSNTSIISETALVVDSPRAKRAARRASTAGSDGEAPITPIRQTRRTRKDSASSVEKETQLPPKQGKQIAEIIIEEPEVNTIKSIPSPEDTNDQSNSPNNTRRSPRILKKTNKTTPAKIRSEQSSDDIPISEPAIFKQRKNSLDSVSLNQEDLVIQSSKPDVANLSNNKTSTSENRLSIASANLIKELNTDVTSKFNLNKSLSDAENKKSEIKRKRTKSWATSASNDNKFNKFYSDSEIDKNTMNNNIVSPLVLINKNGSGDGSFNESLYRDKSKKSISKIKKPASMNFTVENINEPLDNVKSIKNSIVIESKNESIKDSQNNTKKDNILTIDLFKREPSGNMKTMVFIEDSDSNSEKVHKPAIHESEDQCVPVVEHPVEEFPVKLNSFTSILDPNEQNILNKSKELVIPKDICPVDCEPMDIDETIPENVITPEAQSPKNNQPDRKSVSVHISNLSSEEVVNKSKRKSSITQSLDRSEIETKSTLILSQIKDSTGDTNNVVKSPQVTTNMLLSKSVDDLNITQEIDVKKNLSLHYSTSTPLQEKNIQKFKGIHVNTSIIASQNNDSKNTIKDVGNMSKDKYNNTSINKNIDLSKDHIMKENQLKKGKDKKTPKKESIDIQSEIVHSKELIENDKELLNDKQINVKDALNQQSGSESEDVSLDKKSNNLSEVKKSQKNDISSSEESGDEIESDDDSEKKSNFVFDEAIDAGDSYESGDSQDESEQRYEKENEIIDKGETLTTDEEFSDNSDYEKDSFIVSSNEEDEELLDGSDDDLSMSDNELKMTSKSKKKFDERKVKEQKKASREMFASRHGLNSLNKSSNSEIGATKKNKRQQISSSESEEDIPIKPKKNNRLRLDSTKEASFLADEKEIKISKKKSKQLSDSDSSSDESTPNEKEMTICNETVKESDPLSQIKVEPKTPQKSADSTIAFIDSEDVDNDRINKNESTMTQTELLDPLQATMAADDDEDDHDDSLSSDNENIIQNYDSVLQDLNKSSNLKAKVFDISLNIHNKRKKKVKTTLVEELNLTQVKSSKKLNNKHKEENNTSLKEIISKTEEDNASSDSIDLHLLFSEDSNNSDTSSLQNKMKNTSTNSEVIIPLKRTEAKTDVRECKVNKDASRKSMDVSFNNSITNSNKHKSQHQENISSKEESTSFFIDTMGSHADSLDKSHNSSLKRKNNQLIGKNNSAMDKSVNEAIKTNPIVNSDDEAPLEVSYQKENASKRKSKSQENENDIVVDVTDVAEKSINKSIAKTPTSEKKKNKKMDDVILDQTDNICNTTANKSALKTPNSGKKKKRQSETCHMEQNELPVDQSLNVSQIKTPGSQKIRTSDPLTDNQEVTIETGTSEKKKLKGASNSFSVENEIPSVSESRESETSSKKRKRKSSLNTTKEDIPPADASSKTFNESLVGSKKKKRKIALLDEIATVAEAVPNVEEHNKKQDQKIFSSNVSNARTGIDEVNKKRNKKRKQREEDETTNQSSKMLKQNIFHQVPRLPPTLLEKLDDVPNKEIPTKKTKVISTSQFLVQETKKRKNKPSNYLEESVCLNETFENKTNNKKRLDKPKVLPFVPTASTSTSGFTTNFKINVVPSDIKFVAQSNTISSFRDNYMYGNKIRRLGTYDMYKRQRNVKLSKF
ncbi:protein slender lobes isoform X2 [Pararge aegeria]|uniref:protein slender lobes isoform X2 n=1 Tax=Pararge aegeria TaxID=116150 RepID=UPI0019D02FC5|nr:protein slender lobes isoform X2 [Pararge aegeria]